MNDQLDSIFRRYYSRETFRDRFLTDPDDSVDVIIPVVHTNELWESNLNSLYREIPINRLLIGDGGCIDDSIEIALKFPRVEVFDHTSYVSLGYSVRKLIEAVETEWFIYIHSDVYLPDGWFDAMRRHQAEYDWFGCSMQHTVMVEYRLDYGVRPWAGSQMGRKVAFEEGLAQIDDDYIYRQEDFVFANLVKQAGFKEGRVDDTFHYHQTIHKPSPWARQVQSVKLDTKIDHEEEVRTHTMQARGIVKYLEPNPDLFHRARVSLLRLFELGELDWHEFKRWVTETNPAWLPYMRWIPYVRWLQRIKRTLTERRLCAFLKTAYRRLFFRTNPQE